MLTRLIFINERDPIHIQNNIRMLFCIGNKNPSFYTLQKLNKWIFLVVRIVL